jgi:hypothetical protein
VGFREPDSTITIRFAEGHRYHGLEAVCRSTSIEEYAAMFGWDGEPENDGITIKRFYNALISWNLTDKNDQPVPVSDAPTRDQKLMRELSKAWVQGLVGVTDNDPLPETSPSGETSPAPPIPMTPVAESPSQPN